MTQILQLTLTADGIDKHCCELKAQARNPAHLLTALMALQTLITTYAPPGDQAAPAYRDIQATLERHAAIARENLLQETASMLQTALATQDRYAIVRAHGSLSRNGFWQAVALAAQQAGSEHLARAAGWLETWCQQEKQRAQDASPYPDCLDFKAAGIDQQEYAAMDEARRALDAAGWS